MKLSNERLIQRIDNTLYSNDLCCLDTLLYDDEEDRDAKCKPEGCLLIPFCFGIRMGIVRSFK